MKLLVVAYFFFKEGGFEAVKIKLDKSNPSSGWVIISEIKRKHLKTLNNEIFLSLKRILKLFLSFL